MIEVLLYYIPVLQLCEITETQKYPSIPTDEGGPDTGDADNSYKPQEIEALKVQYCTINIINLRHFRLFSGTVPVPLN